MPLIHMRIDNRLIHGQVTVAWVGYLGADRIMVVNDKVAQDPIQKQLLPNAARGVKTSVLGIDEAIEYLGSEKAQKEKIMVVAKYPSDALELLEKGADPKEVIVGNQATIPGTKPKHITRSIAVTADQAPIYRSIAEKGYNLRAKVMPSDSGLDFIKALGKHGL